MDVAQGIKSLSNFLFFCCSITPFSGKESMGQGMSFFSLSRSCLYPSLLWLTVLPFFFRCLAHFPPADTYESRGDAADVSCVLSTFHFFKFCFATSQSRVFDVPVAWPLVGLTLVIEIICAIENCSPSSTPGLPFCCKRYLQHSINPLI